MRATLTTWSRFGLLPLMFMTLSVVIIRVGRSQPPPPNQPVLYAGKWCWPTGVVSCPICPTGTPGGSTCSTIYGGAWKEGSCDSGTFGNNNGPGCYGATPYDCGSAQTCTTPARLTGAACATPNTCSD